MEIKVNDYVRYKYENCIYIGKIKFISEVMGFEETLQFDIDNCIEEIFKKDIIKTSPRIIDLIEVGDYVNGVIVTQSYIDNIKHIAPEIKENNYGIKSIVTKEMFEQMEYKIND